MQCKHPCHDINHQYLMGPAVALVAPAELFTPFQPRKKASMSVARALMMAPAMSVRASEAAAPCKNRLRWAGPERAG